MYATFRKRLNSVDWASYCTACGPAVEVPGQLLRLASGGEEAMAASHNLWCGLCHQHAFGSSAALPALPFILENLDRAEEALTYENLDILLGFASCTRPGAVEDALPWTLKLRRCFSQQLPRLQEVARLQNESISGFASRIIGELAADGNPGMRCP